MDATTFPIESPSQRLKHVTVEFTTNGTGAPSAANTVDNDRVLSSAGASRTAAGKYKLPLRERFNKVRVRFAYTASDTLDSLVKGSIVVQGSAADNYAQVHIITPSTGAALDPTADKVIVGLELEDTVP